MSDLGALRRELTEFSQRSFNRHLVSGTGGNLSLRVPGTDTVLITPSGVSLGDIEPEMNILVNLDGEILDSPMNFKGSKETGFHLEAYRTRQGCAAVAHVHPPYATAYSCLGKDLPLVTISARVGLNRVPCVECFMPGSTELCSAVSGGITDYPESNALLMKKHGILTMAESMSLAYYVADLVEDSAKIAFVAANIHTDI